VVVIAMEREELQQHREALQADRALQRERGEAMVEQLARSFELNGYDWNVLNEWARQGYWGARPELSFELRAKWIAESQREEAAELRERERAKQSRKAQQERLEQLRAESEAEVRRRKEYPLKAEAEDVLKQAKANQRRKQLEQQEAERMRMEAGIRRKSALLERGKSKKALLGMDEMTFLEWCELAPAAEVQGFADALRRDGELARRPAALRWVLDLAEAFCDD